MSKRTDTIRSCSPTPQVETLSADNSPAALPRVSSGSVRSLKDSFSGVERENEELRRENRSRARSCSRWIRIWSIPRRSTDRFKRSGRSSFEALKASIQQRGQEVPILIRDTRLRLGGIRAPMGIEGFGPLANLASRQGGPSKAYRTRIWSSLKGSRTRRDEDLSFIERAVFAMHLENAGHERSIVQEALSIDRAEASKLLSVARSVPSRPHRSDRTSTESRAWPMAIACRCAARLWSAEARQGAIESPGFSRTGIGFAVPRRSLCREQGAQRRAEAPRCSDDQSHPSGQQIARVQQCGQRTKGHHRPRDECGLRDFPRRATPEPVRDLRETGSRRINARRESLDRRNSQPGAARQRKRPPKRPVPEALLFVVGNSRESTSANHCQESRRRFGERISFAR